MKITAHDLIAPELSFVSYQNTIGEAIDKMHDAVVRQIVLINEQQVAGLLFLEDLENEGDEKQKLYPELIREVAIAVNGKLHVLDVVKLISSNHLEVLPVLDEQMQYVGCLKWETLLSVVSEMLAIKVPGSILMLRRLPIDYSMAEIARICESNDYRIISSGIMKEEGTQALIITLKVDRNELHMLISAFERYEYEVIAFFGDANYRDFLKERYDLLINYLNM